MAVNAIKILVLGSGMVARPCVEYLLRNPKNNVTIGKETSHKPHRPCLTHYYLNSMSNLVNGAEPCMEPTSHYRHRH